MTDRVDKQTRHRIMASNHAKNTGPELEVRKALFHRGFRYRLHDRKLPGNPDIVLPGWRVVIFVHGCYWHGHDCKRKPRSKSNLSFWNDKIERNRNRDAEAKKQLLEMGWRVLIIWECAIRRQSPAFSESDYLSKVVDWIKGNNKLAVLSEAGLETNI